MSGTSTPSFRLSSTTMRVLPPSRRKAFSCSSAQMRELERKESKRTASRLQGLVSAQLAHETFDGLIAATESTLGHQVLPDRHGIATLAQTEFDRITERFAQTGGRNERGRLMF